MVFSTTDLIAAGQQQFYRIHALMNVHTSFCVGKIYLSKISDIRRSRCHGIKIPVASDARNIRYHGHPKTSPDPNFTILILPPSN